MGVTIAILSSLCAALAAAYLYAESRNSILKKTIEETEKRIKDLETELKEFREQQRIANENSQNKSEKKPPRKIDFTGVFMR